MVLHDPTGLAFGTVADLARKARTSRPSVVRFASKLGFSGYSELQAWIREGVTRRLSIPSHRIRLRDPDATVRANIVNAVAHTFDTLDDARLGSMAGPIVSARRVWILSGETSLAGAHVLHSGLSMLRPDVHLVMEHSTGRDLCGAGRGDTAVILDFSRYRKIPVVAAQSVAEMGLDIVAITDGPLSPLASLTPNWCELRIPAVGPFDSSAPSVIAAELLVARVARELGDTARDRIDQLESLWQRVDTFLEYTTREARPGPGPGLADTSTAH